MCEAGTNPFKFPHSTYFASKLLLVLTYKHRMKGSDVLPAFIEDLPQIETIVVIFNVLLLCDI